MSIRACDTIFIAQVSQVRVTTPGSSFHMAFLAVDAKMELIISYADDLGILYLRFSIVVDIFTVPCLFFQTMILC